MNEEQWARIEAKRAQAKYFRDLERSAYLSTLKRAPAPKTRRKAKPKPAPAATDKTRSIRGLILICTGTCGRPLRKSGILLADMPGSVRAFSGSKCKACTAAEKPKKPALEVDPCKSCGHPLRPSHVPLTDRPGTKVHGGRGLCHTCRKRMLPDGTVRPPKVRTIAHDGTTTCIDCTRTLRTSATKIADAPGTVPVRFRLAEGYVCLGCSKKRARA